ncbi:MAG: PSD1 and planctomycete cytochrome C domain-containing protein [Acidobacteria bacterium]|nr:PSD1 and planctomycete cytochrome C domain-containing protein [Acidobacteriota bacterium]
MSRERIIRTSFLALATVTAWLGPQRASGRAEAAGANEPAPAKKVDFAREIQPILEKSCYNCHGSKMQLGGLRLDSRKLAFDGGQSGKAIISGKSADSHLYQRVAGIGEQARMPMGGEPLPAEQIRLIRAWIDQGAEWPEGAGIAAAEIKKHWAYIAPQQLPLPNVSNAKWPANPIDQFILTRLEKEGLSPSPEADRAILLRRLSLDLIGLPPTIKEIDAFLKDKGKSAYEKQVERLLASPHYGERWGRHWLDAARYADSDGYEKDKQRWVWFYRDWVIKALNHDLPYNQFIIEQLAGDQLPNATQDQIVATGFLRNSMINEEGGVDPEQFRIESMFDRMEAAGKSILGVTIQCAQCHNHKYDPLTQEEYYRIFAFLNDSHESNLAVYTPEEQMKRAELFREIREIESKLQHRSSDWQERMARWDKQVKSGQPEWIVVRPEVEDISTGGQKYSLLKDGSFLAQGFAPTKSRVKMTVKTDVQNITAFRLELLNDPNLPLSGPGRSIKGTAALTEFDVEAAPADAPTQAKPVKIARATADILLPRTPLDPIYDDKSQLYRVTGPVEFAIDDCEETAWGIDAGPGRRNQPRKAVFAAGTPIANPKGTLLTFYLNQKHGGWNSDDNQNHNLGRFRLSITTTPGAAADPLPKNVRDILSIPREQRTPAQVQTVFSYWRTTVPDGQEANAKIEVLWKHHPEGSSQLVLQAREESRGTHMLSRGDFLKPGKAVSPGVPAFLHPLPKDPPPNRLTFAKWLVDRNSPTTARAMVNRIWQNYFGIGLVSTSEDLGKQSEPPSHPELLDWLAVEFMDRGWSLKSIHRLIVKSATYRQSSRVTPELYSRDPYNRLLARGPRFRVEAEIVRDISLAASGLLNPKIGGPSVYPPAPDFLFVPPASYGPKNWYETKSPDRYRRALYTFRFRSVPYPMLQNFDAPNGDSSCVRRVRSNTPLQALTTLNEPLFLDSARALALQTIKEGGKKDAQRLVYAFRRCLGRKPTEAEATELLALLNKQTQRFESGQSKPWDLAAANPDQAPTLPKKATPAQLAAWTAISRVLLNLDETITKE